MEGCHLQPGRYALRLIGQPRDRGRPILRDYGDAAIEEAAISHAREPGGGLISLPDSVNTTIAT